jgi:hypothetical protein
MVLTEYPSLAGEYQRARALDGDTLARRRRVLGDDRPDTLPMTPKPGSASLHRALPPAHLRTDFESVTRTVL